MDPALPVVVAAIFGVLLLGALARRLRQPYVIGYLVAGIAIGPFGLGLFEDAHSLARLGEVGVILLLFFVGMEVDLTRLLTSWKISVFGTALQILASLGAVAILGIAADWPTARIVLLGFAISLSSTALVMSMLRQRRELETAAGRDVLGILLVQDVAVIAMLIVVGLFAGDRPSVTRAALQTLGGLAFLGLLAYLVRGRSITLPLGRWLRNDHELQVFGAFILCFGLAWLSSLLGLSTALGAFAAGLVVAAARETDWIHRSLEPYRVLFVAAFFVSVGALIDLDFVVDEWHIVVGLVVAALVTNTLINAGALRSLGRSWASSFYSGALLSQVGEFSFVLAAVGRESGVIGEYAFQGVMAMIVGTLLVTPLWIGAFRMRRRTRSLLARESDGTPGDEFGV